MAESGLGIEDAVSDSDKFEVGAAVINEMTLKLNNFEGAFNKYEFKGAVFKPWIGLTTKVHWRDGEITEKIPKGVFTCNESPTIGSIISITADDNMSKFDAAYSKSSIKYPATLGQIVADVCTVCKVTLATATFPNSTYSVATRPSESSTTCREIISYAAQLAGCFARCNADGELEIKWYSEPTTIFDVGKYATSYDADTTDTKITGVKIQGTDDDKTVYSSGTDNFVLRIKDNPLAQDNLQSLANTLGTKFNGFSFRAYTVSSPANPAIEAGDIVNMTDKKGVTHKTLVSHISYEYGESEQYNADAETTAENQSERFSKADKAQETAEKAQQSADEAKDGVAKAEVKIGDLEITIKGKVSFSDLKGSGTTEINGDNIVTGKIQSEDGSWWLNLETGEVHMEKGTFAGVIEWLQSSGAIGGKIFYTSDGGLRIESNSSITLDAADISFPRGSDAEIHSLNDVDLDNAYSGDVGITMSDGSKRTLRFKNGILVSNH